MQIKSLFKNLFEAGRAAVHERAGTRHLKSTMYMAISALAMAPAVFAAAGYLAYQGALGLAYCMQAGAGMVTAGQIVFNAFMLVSSAAAIPIAAICAVVPIGAVAAAVALGKNPKEKSEKTAAQPAQKSSPLSVLKNAAAAFQKSAQRVKDSAQTRLAQAAKRPPSSQAKNIN